MTMASYSDVIEGLQLFARREGLGAHHVEARHEVVYAGSGSPPEKLSADELKDLEKWGWVWEQRFVMWRRFV